MKRLLPVYRLGLGVLQDFIKLRMDSQAKNIAAWTPVIAEILQGFARFDDKAVGSILTRTFTAAHDLPSLLATFLLYIRWRRNYSHETLLLRLGKTFGTTL